MIPRVVTTSDGRRWNASQVGTIGKADTGAHYVILLADSHNQRRLVGADQPLTELPDKVLTAVADGASELQSFELWKYRLPGMTIQPPGRSLTPGAAPLTGIGRVNVGGQVVLKTDGDIAVTVEARGALQQGVYTGVITDIAGESPQLAIGQSVMFHDDHVWRQA